jgi:hypothetical protein
MPYLPPRIVGMFMMMVVPITMIVFSMMMIALIMLMVVVSMMVVFIMMMIMPITMIVLMMMIALIMMVVFSMVIVLIVMMIAVTTMIVLSMMMVVFIMMFMTITMIVISMMIVFMMMIVVFKLHDGPCPGYAAAFVPDKVQFPSRKAQGSQGGGQCIGVNPQVNKGPQRHIPGDARMTVEVQNLHGRSPAFRPLVNPADKLCFPHALVFVQF